MTVLFTYLTTSTKFGKKIYAIGSNKKGALMAGILIIVILIQYAGPQIKGFSCRER